MERHSSMALYFLACVGLLSGFPEAWALTVEDKVMDEHKECFKITTQSATYFFQKVSAGFSSILDKNGNDWVGYRPGGGSGGEYRGIPNLGGCCHPGYPTSSEGVAMTTTLVSKSSSKAVLLSVSGDGKWQTRWEFAENYATCTVEKVGKSYWFLYEGTPGGALETDKDYYVRPDKGRTMVSQGMSAADMAAPEWILFGDLKMKRSIVLFQHADDNIKDVFWQMNGQMTVFGFGRTCNGVCFGLTKTPNKFSIALMEDTTKVAATAITQAMLSNQTPVVCSKVAATTGAPQRAEAVFDLFGSRNYRSERVVRPAGVDIVVSSKGIAACRLRR